MSVRATWPDRSARSAAPWAGSRLGSNNDRAHALASPYMMPKGEVSKALRRWIALTERCEAGDGSSVGWQRHHSGANTVIPTDPEGTIEMVYKYCLGRQYVTAQLANHVVDMIERVRRSGQQQLADRGLRMPAPGRAAEEGTSPSIGRVSPNEVYVRAARRRSGGQHLLDGETVSKLLRQLSLLKLNVAQKMADTERATHRPKAMVTLGKGKLMKSAQMAA